MCVCISYIFIHSSVDGHLDGFCALAIVNSASVSTGVHVFFQTGVSLWMSAQEYDCRIIR